MNSHIGSELRKAGQSLKNGFRIILFKRIHRADLNVSYDQAFLLSIIFSLIFFIGGYLSNLPEPSFSAYGIATVAIQLTFLTIFSYCISYVVYDKQQIAPIFILILSIWPIIYLGALLIGHDYIFYYWHLFGPKKYIYIAFNIWLASVIITAISRTYHLHKKQVLLVLIIYVLTVALPLNYVSLGGFWHQSYKNNAEEEYAPVNVEDTYYQQFELLHSAQETLLPERQGVSDLYFVGFGSYASEDVFMKEVQYAHGLLDEKFDTKGRSVVLINNNQTVNTTMLASKSNLERVLTHIGSLINPDEDILFLYLTSHGSKTHQLSVDFWPLELNSFGPSDLKSILDSSGIKNRILLVSACYSGGYIDPLKDDNTLIFTASAADKTSFGCGDLNDFTYFGNAIFNEEIKNDFNLIEVFKKAASSIEERETAEQKTHSEPQLFIGSKIEEKLLALAEQFKERGHHLTKTFE